MYFVRTVYLTLGGPACGGIWVYLTAFYLEACGAIWFCLTPIPAFYQEAWRHVGLFDIRASLYMEAWRYLGLFDIRASLLSGSLAACGFVLN